MNIFLFHRDLRIIDNTSLINQIENHETSTPIFIFPPEQINPKKNKYFSNNSVQFMIESLHDLADSIKNMDGELYFFKGDNLKVLEAIHKNEKIKSIAFNIDYSPYARKRDNIIKNWCNKNNIECIMKEDYLLYDIMKGETKKQDGTPYMVFTPFKNYCLKNLKVRAINKFNKFNFKKYSNLKKIKYNITEKQIDDFYQDNPLISVHGGRSNGLKILSHLEKWDEYDAERDFFSYNTTKLSAHNHFTTISIREVYYKIIEKLGKNTKLINELHWRDFYTNITFNFPHILQGQVKGKNKALKYKYDMIKWSHDKKLIDCWSNAKTGFILIDAAMEELNQTGFQHNRGRMNTSSFLVKILHIDWRIGEKIFATKLTDYDAMINNNSWQWTSGSGTDAQPYFRIFNVWTQLKKFDPDCSYVKKWLPELKDIPNNDLFNWYDPEIHEKWLKLGIKYYKPIVDYTKERNITLNIYKKSLK